MYRTLLKDGGSNFQNKFDANDDDLSRDENYHKALQTKSNDDDLQNSAKKLKTIESTYSKNPEIEQLVSSLKELITRVDRKLGPT